MFIVMGTPQFLFMVQSMRTYSIFSIIIEKNHAFPKSFLAEIFEMSKYSAFFIRYRWNTADKLQTPREEVAEKATREISRFLNGSTVHLMAYGEATMIADLITRRFSAPEVNVSITFFIGNILYSIEPYTYLHEII